jgi:glycerate dehydrogenase
LTADSEDAAVQEIVFIDRDTIAPQIHFSTLSFPHRMTQYGQSRPDQVVDRAKNATIIINNKVRLTGEILAQLPKLRLISVAATGSDCIDKAYCREHGIAVANIRGYAVNTVPEHAMGLILALQRNLVAYRQDVIDGRWQAAGQFCFFDHPIRDLSGKKLGIIGKGVLGERVARLGQAFGMEAMFAARKGASDIGPSYTPWDEVIETSDVITLHCPLTPSTEGMIAYPEFLRMKKRPILINVSRGRLVVEEDLERALDEGLIAGAGFDVTMPEPPPLDSPIMHIASRPNVIVTPHVAWASDEAQQTLTDQVFNNIENFVAGRPSNIVSGDF